MTIEFDSKNIAEVEAVADAMANLYNNLAPKYKSDHSSITKMFVVDKGNGEIKPINHS